MAHLEHISAGGGICGTSPDSGHTQEVVVTTQGDIDTIFTYGDPCGAVNAEQVKDGDGRIIPNPDFYGHGQ